MAKCATGQVYNVKLRKCITKKKSTETSLRLESLETKKTGQSRLNPTVGKRRPGVSDPRFSRLRGNKKKDPINLVGKAISKDKESRRYKKRIAKKKKKQ